MRALIFGLFLCVISLTGEAARLNESVSAIMVKVKDINDVEETRKVTITQYKPDGAGPFPIVVISVDQTVRQQHAFAYSWWVNRLAVIPLPQRPPEIHVD